MSQDHVFLAVATCSHLGRELLIAGGNVVDAGVGAALCLAVVHPHTTGLGQCPTAPGLLRDLYRGVLTPRATQ